MESEPHDLSILSRKPFQFSLRSLLFVFVLVGVVIQLLYFAVSIGPTSNVFSPDTLECRSRSHWYFLNVDLGHDRSFRYELVNFLIEKGYWKPQQVQQPKWIKAGHQSAAGRLLYRHRVFLKSWTESHREMASQLWPWILEIMRNKQDCERYLSDDIWVIGLREAKDIDDFKRIVRTDFERDDLDLESLGSSEVKRTERLP